LEFSLVFWPRSKQRQSQTEDDANIRVSYRSGNFDQNLAILDFYRVRPQIDADGGTLGLAGPIIKASIVLGTFDHMIHHQAVGQVNLLIRGAKATRNGSRF
jgi:hypothetical protein